MRNRPARTSINASERSWPAHVQRLWDEKVAPRIADDLAAGGWVSLANYFTPRPWVDDYNRGSSKAGFCFTLQPGNRVIVSDWHQTFGETPVEERYR